MGCVWIIRFGMSALRAKMRIYKDDKSPHWIKEKVSFDAAYANDQVTALLFLPRNVRPPYQAV